LEKIFEETKINEDEEDSTEVKRNPGRRIKPSSDDEENDEDEEEVKPKKKLKRKLSSDDEEYNKNEEEELKKKEKIAQKEEIDTLIAKVEEVHINDPKIEADIHKEEEAKNTEDSINKMIVDVENDKENEHLLLANSTEIVNVEPITEKNPMDVEVKLEEKETTHQVDEPSHSEPISNENEADVVNNEAEPEIKKDEENDANEETETKQKEDSLNLSKNQNIKVEFEILDHFFGFLDDTTELNYVLVGYFSKIFTHFLNIRGAILLKYLFVHKPNFLFAFTKHLNRKSITECINRILTSYTDDITDSMTMKISLIEKIMEHFNPQDSEVSSIIKKLACNQCL